MNTNKKQGISSSFLIIGSIVVLSVWGAVSKLEKEKAALACGFASNVTVSSNMVSISVGRLKGRPQSEYQSAIDELRELMPKRMKYRCPFEEVDRNAIDMLRKMDLL
jgi:hypothetical protein